MTLLIFAVGLAIVAGMVGPMIRLERAQRRVIKRRRDAWEATGGVGVEPDDPVGHGGSVNFGTFGH
jgi:hypothetical protein